MARLSYVNLNRNLNSVVDFGTTYSGLNSTQRMATADISTVTPQTRVCSNCGCSTTLPSQGVTLYSMDL